MGAQHEAEVEHSLAREGIAKMNDLVDEDGFGAAVAMVTAGIKHHVKEEEQELFPKVEKNFEKEELEALGDQMESTFDELIEQAPRENIPMETESAPPLQ